MTITPFKRVSEFKNQGFEVKDKKLWCSKCGLFIDFINKTVIKNHILSKKHSSKFEGMYFVNLPYVYII